ncbi:MAG: hypothetical protein EA428_02330 [Spirochaetaceae bacterium]|nr:MAG: hypothetical protein EA428_02330 [Spirochaetaceae bacterium]
MKKKGGLERARKLYNSRDYGEVIRFLEPQVFLYRERPEFYRLLGMSCLYDGDFSGASSYLQRSQQLDDDDTETRLGLALIHVRRRETQKALNHWLYILERDPGNRQAKRGLDLVRAADDPSEFMQLFEDDSYLQLLPARRLKLPKAAMRVSVVTVIVLLLIGLSLQMVERLRSPDPPDREGVELVRFDTPPANIVEYDGEYRYILGTDEVRRSFSMVGEYFNERRDNLAIIEINRLLNSNASQAYKERARMLMSYMSRPSFTDFRDNIEYRQVEQEPWLYNNTHVRWKGRVTNLNIGTESITFDFLVGYHDERVLEGIVPVTLPFAAALEGAMPIELIAKLQTNDTIERLVGVSVRRIAPEFGGDSANRSNSGN